MDYAALIGTVVKAVMLLYRFPFDGRYFQIKGLDWILHADAVIRVG